MSGVDVEVDTSALKAVSRAFRAEEDGKQLRKELVAELKAAIAPGVSAVQGKLRSMPHSSAVESSPSLGSYLAARVKPQVRTGGRSAGVAIRIAKTPSLRGFAFAARRLNNRTWRHKVFGREVWVEQTSPIPGFFDDTLQADKSKYQKAVHDVLEEQARRIAERSR